MNNFYLNQSIRTNMTLAAAAIAVFSFATPGSSGIQSSGRPIVTPELVGASNQYTIFRNSQPTTQATDFLVKNLDTKNELSWIDKEITSFMGLLKTNKLPTYSDDLMDFANIIMSKYPDSLS